ncbi:MAG: hypothetical protein WKG07_07585 [Hymenobacter sp.]
MLFARDNAFTGRAGRAGRSARGSSMAGFKANRIRTLPPRPRCTPALRWLILTDNQLEALPAEIGQCGQLQKLMLAGNRLTPPAHRAGPLHPAGAAAHRRQ